jgi:hypothetical protein
MTALFPGVLGEGFDALPPVVRRMHGGGRITATGRAVSAGHGCGALAARLILGAPGAGRYALRFEVEPGDGGETWSRWFGERRLRSWLRADARDRRYLEERLGLASFRLSMRLSPSGFGWELESWRVGPLPLPRWLGPTVRARCFEVDDEYRFSVVVAHAWLGVVMAYAGRLTIDPSRATSDPRR